MTSGNQAGPCFGPHLGNPVHQGWKPKALVRHGSHEYRLWYQAHGVHGLNLALAPAGE